jgi:hypothetical protein
MYVCVSVEVCCEIKLNNVERHINSYARLAFGPSVFFVFCWPSDAPLSDIAISSSIECIFEVVSLFVC